MAFGWGNRTCSDLPPAMDNAASSAKYSGAQYDYTNDALSIYRAEFFAGNEEYAVADKPSTLHIDKGKRLTSCVARVLEDHFNRA